MSPLPSSAKAPPKTPPRNWVELVFHAMSLWGLGVLVVPVYLDLKASNDRFAQIAAANAQATTIFSQRLEEATRRSERREDATLETINLLTRRLEEASRRAERIEELLRRLDTALEPKTR